MYVLTFSSLFNLWGQLSEHLCLFWTFTAAERSAPALGLTCLPLLTPRGSPLPASPEPTCQDTPLPILLLPKPRSIVSSKGNLKPSSLYSAEKKHGTSKTRSIQSVHSLSSLAHQIPAPNPPIVTSAAEVKNMIIFYPTILDICTVYYAICYGFLFKLEVWNSLVFNMSEWTTHLSLYTEVTDITCVIGGLHKQ